MRIVATVVACLAVTAMFPGCGGGNSNSGKSGVKNNEHIGSLLTLIADANAAKKADDAKIEKLQESGDFEKMAKEATKIENAAKEREAKLEADIEAVKAKIAGKDIPFTYSAAFKEMNCEAGSVKIERCDNTGFTIAASIVAKSDFALSYNDKNNDAYENIWFKALAKDGATIEKGSFYIAGNAGWGKTKSFTKGQSLQFDGKNASSYLPVSKNPEKWVEFASIEFITSEESRNIK